MKKIVLIILTIVPLILGAQSRYYVAVDGNDGNPGTISQPFATWQRGFTAANQPGDTLFIRGGVYMNDLPISYNPDAFPTPTGGIGTYENPIVITGYPGEWPILDCVNHCNNIPVRPEAAGRYNSAIGIHNTEHIKFMHFEVRNVLQCDPVVDGAIGAAFSCNLTFEHIILHDIGQRGFAVQGGVWTSTDGADPNIPIEASKWGFGHPDTTRFINCDVYNLADSLSSAPGNAADAWKTIHYDDNVIIWEGCRAWNYTDDGFDPNGKGSIRIMNNCWAMPGDAYKSGLDASWDVERNGIKASGPQFYYDANKTHLSITNSIAYDCNHGFILMETNDYNRLNAHIFNNTIIRCGIGIANWDDDRNDVPSPNIYKNNIIHATTSNNAAGFPYNTFILTDVPYDVSHCTWRYNPSAFQNTDLNPNYNVTDEDFVSMNHATIFAQLTAPRKADGSLPDITALQLREGSDLIDGGIDVGIPYYGSAPDLGAFEYSAAVGIPPTASFTVTPTTINEGESVAFDASGSTDSDGTIVSYSWNLGNITANGIVINNTYTDAGIYNVVLTVTDNDGNSASTNVTIIVNAIETGEGIYNIETLETAMINAQPGDILYLNSNSFSDDVIINCNGTSVNPVIITYNTGLSPAFEGNVTVTGDHVTLTGITFNGGLTLNSFDTDVTDCTINSPLTFTRPSSPTVYNCVFNGLNDIIIFTNKGYRVTNWVIDNNTYYIDSDAKFNGLNRSEWRAKYDTLDKNSIFIIN